MAEKILIELDLEKGDVSGAVKGLEDAGDKAGRRAASNFKSKFGRGVAGSFKSLGRQALKVGSVLTGVAAALTGIQSIRAAQVQEDAINSLNVALLASKNAGIDASAGIQTFASELQKSSRFGDEVILQNAALIQSLGDLDEKGLKRATQAAADLASRLRIDLTSAATLVGKAAAGEVGSFSRYGLVIKKGADNAETFANALGQIESKFGGGAAGDIATYSGAAEQLSNAFGDVLEVIGGLVTNNPKFVKAIKMATGVITSVGSEIDKFGKNNDFFDIVTTNAIKLGDTLIKYVARPIEFIGNLFNVSKNILASGINTVIAAFAKMGSVISTVLESVGIETKLGNQIQAFSNTATQAAVIGGQKTQEAFGKLFDFSISDKLTAKKEAINTFFQDVIAKTDENSTIIKEKNDIIANEAIASSTTFADAYTGVFSGLTSGLDGVGSKAEDVAARMKRFSLESGKALQQGFAKGAGDAFAEFGKAAANGENALEAFGKSLIKAVGQQAITLGTKFILEGTAYLFSPGFQGLGPPLIAAGAGLAAFGGALGAVVGGGGASSSSGGGSSVATNTGNGGISPEEVIADPEVTRAEERTNVTLNIEGSIVRESEASNWLSDLLETSGSRDSNIIPSLRTGTV